MGDDDFSTLFRFSRDVWQDACTNVGLSDMAEIFDTLRALDIDPEYLFDDMFELYLVAPMWHLKIIFVFVLLNWNEMKEEDDTHLILEVVNRALMFFSGCNKTMYILGKNKNVIVMVDEREMHKHSVRILNSDP